MKFLAEDLFLFAILTAVFYSTNAQTFGLGGCKKIQGVNYINYDKLQGVWYEYARSPRHDEDNARCNTFVMDTPVKGIKPTQRFQISKFLFWEFQKSVKTNSPITGAGKYLNPDNFDVTYLDVDYDHYIVSYGCQNYMLARNDILWIFTRERFPSCDILLKAYNAVWNYDLTLDNLQRINHKNCPDTWSPNPSLLDSIFQGRG